ncbi:MAG: carboxypeptidase regulatory-like domain-containing protein, partial [Acidobacteria bacterium]|nr:carboxypeptidase regulatory-like domain-containing protein [Acidobacteriota bacterium]
MRCQLFLRTLLVCVFLGSGMAVAQVTTGTILGTTSDSTGAVIPGATVTLRNVDTGNSRTITTDAAGRYRAPQLPLGSYEIAVEAAGFQTAVRTGVTLTVGREAVLDFTLQVGAVAERITVTGEAPLIETTNATVAGLIDEQKMRDLPLNGRSFTDLTAIQPGVVADIGIAPTVFGGGKRISMNGARPQQSLYLLDGTDIVAPYMNVTPASALGEFLGVETTREFTVIQTNAGAQYGRAIGGIVNAVTRSGTNEFHGNVFEFLRNDKLNANDFFLNRRGAETPVLKRNQFGATLGGPVKKDSTFFFLAYEGLRHRQGNPTVQTVLTPEARTGWITHCATGVSSCTTPVPQTAADTVKVNEDIKPMLPLILLPNTGLYLREGTSQWIGTLLDSGSENYGMARMDQKISDNDNLFGRFTIDNSDLNQPKAVNRAAIPSGMSVGSDVAYRFAAVEETHVFSPTLLNTVRIGFNRYNGLSQDIFKASEYPSVMFVMPDASGNIVRDGLPSIGGAGGLVASGAGLGGGPFTQFRDNTYIYGDTVNWNPGAHSVAFGGNVTRYQMNTDTRPWARGDISFANERNFLRGIVRNAINPIVVPDTFRGWRQTYGAWFVQDDWNVRSGFTLNVGLRWERVTAPTEASGKLAGLEHILEDTKYTQFTDSLFHLRDPLKGLAPRIGFAWTPFADQKTVFRGAAGVFKEIMLEYQYQLASFVPPWAEKFNLQAPPWPDPIRRATTISAGEPNVMDRNMVYPYNLQWNFGVEHQLTSTLVTKATYIGTRSLHLVGTANAYQNIPIKKFDPTVGYERWYTPPDAQKPNQTWASTRSWHNIGNAWYNSLQLQLEQRYNSGLSYNFSYTFSKNLDTVGIGNKCGELSGAGGTFYVYNLYDVAADKSLSNLHAPHNLSASFGYELPFGSGRRFGSGWSGILNSLAGGWQFNGIVTRRTGQPIKVANNFDRAHNGAANISDRPDLAPGKSNNPVLENWTVDAYFDRTAYVLQPDGFYGNLARQPLIAPGITNVNLSIFK